ncbi:MAG: sulfotransferase family protein [Proteobacteria bacterium]|nr:sulfotransferase family protein [Pseudomonadota bacterium]
MSLIFIKSLLKRSMPQFRVKSPIAKKWPGLSVQQMIDSNNKIIDQKIIKWSALLKRSERISPSHRGGFHVLFPHIPKTGGTSLDHIIAKNYKVDFIKRINAEAVQRNLASMFKLHKKHQCYRIIMGHLELSDVVYQLLDRKKMVQLVMFREPVSRVISYWDYLRASPNHPKHKIALKLSLSEFVNCKKINDIFNGQTYQLLGLLKNNVWKKTPEPEEVLFEKAKFQLTNRFSIFGTTEQYAEFLIMAKKLLGWNDIYYQRKNITRLKTKIADVDLKIIEQIKQNNRLDLKVYQFVNNTSNRRYQQLGINKQLLAEYEEKNKLYIKLLTH